MEGLFPRLFAEIEQLRGLIGGRVVALTVPMGDMTHSRMMEIVKKMFVSNHFALALFLMYPTRRMSAVLTKAAADTTAAIAWLAQNPPTNPAKPYFDQQYVACCERIQAGIADWRLSVDLKRAEYDLDLKPPETVH